MSMEYLRIDTRPNGVLLATLDRPPVNAVSIEVYEDLGRLVDQVEASADVRVVVLAAPPETRAWCGGADLNDFVGMDSARRRERYAFVNAVLPRLAALDRPTIAAVNAPAIGVGMILAGLCDLRIAADTATFACPEIDFGLVGGGAGLFNYLNLPQALVREMLFTGQRYDAQSMQAAGFLNHVVPRADVLDSAFDLADRIAAKSLPALRARKQVLVEIEKMGWLDSYLHAQVASATLVAGHDGHEGVRAFLEDRDAQLSDD